MYSNDTKPSTPLGAGSVLGIGAVGAPGTVATTENVFFKDELSQAGVNRIDGMRQLLGPLVAAAPVGASAAELENIIAFTGCSILDAVKMSSVNQAREFDLVRKGGIAPGKDADMVLLSESFAVERTISYGQTVYKNNRK